jgi:oligoendopeptidase F
MTKSWDEIAPEFAALEAQDLTAANVAAWLTAWSRLQEALDEVQQRLYILTTLDTTDAAASARYAAFLDQIFPPFQDANFRLKQKLLASGLTPPGFELPLRDLQAEVSIFREANLPRLSQELKLGMEYDQIIGAQTVEFEGRTQTITAMDAYQYDADRAVREAAWRAARTRQLADRAALNALWTRLFDLRAEIATAADFPTYRDYRWQQLLRHDYTPADCLQFHQAIEEVVVPAVARLNEREQRRLNLPDLRPWDEEVNPFGLPALRPFETVQELEDHGQAIFNQVDPELGAHFALLRREGLLDLGNRPGKAPGAYSNLLALTRRPFVFGNVVGLHTDVQTLLHEAGHAFHDLEKAHLPYYQQMVIPNEFAEVASMSMELLAAPYLTAEAGGFYNEADAARALYEHLAAMLRFWPYMAVVDAFQQWAYAAGGPGRDPAACDAAWTNQWNRFMTAGRDWSGLEDIVATGWQRKLHIFQAPFYYVDYGLAFLGAVGVFRNAQRNQAAAVRAYRHALALGSTATLPELFAAAGTKFAFDAAALGEAVATIETTLDRLEAKIV